MHLNGGHWRACMNRPVRLMPFQQMGLQINFQDKCQMKVLRNTFNTDLFALKGARSILAVRDFHPNPTHYNIAYSATSI